MVRLFYLTKNIRNVESISSDIHHAGVTDWNFHVTSKDEQGLYKRHIHSANMLQKTDIIFSTERGLLRGLGIGLLLALVASQIPFHGSYLSYSTLLLVVALGMILGSWHGVLFGYQNENHKLKPFHQDIEQGAYLIMIDVPKNQAETIRQLMQDRHPEARFCDQDSTLVLPFEKVKGASS